MATPFPFGSGNTLLASQMNAITTLPINDQTASYVALVGDVGKRIVMNVASANTVTINNSVFGVGDTIFIANKGAGATTVTAGAGVTINTSGSLALAQHGGGTLVALSASVFTFFSGGAANVTLPIDVLIVSGGGGGGKFDNTAGAGGGGAGGMFTKSFGLDRATYTVTVGLGGAGQTSVRTNGANGTNSSFILSTTGGGGGSGLSAGSNGGSGGGAPESGQAAGTGIAGQGNDGGLTSTFTGGGGGGGKGSVGGVGVLNNGGSGGTAATNDYTGTSISYAGGGGGGGITTGGTAGTNAGNGGSGASTAGSAATANRGGGGGGSTGTANGGNGGSGEVVIRYKTADATGYTITTTGSPTTGTSGIYSFIQYTATGTLVIA
jgi:hypothetical protein